MTYEVIDPGDEEREPEVGEHGFRVGGRDYPLPDPQPVGDDFIRWCRETGPFDVEVGGYEHGGDDNGDPDPVGAMVDALRRAGATEPDCSPADGEHPATSWRSPDGEQDFRTGEYRYETFHLEGWTPDQLRAVARGVLRR